MTRPLCVVAYDTSPALGGAVTSLDALAEVGVRTNVEITVVARHVRAFAHARHLSRLIPMPEDDVGAIHHGPYLHREVERSVFLRRTFERLAPDVVLTNNAPSANAGAILAAQALDLPVVSYVRGFISPTWFTRGLLKQVSRVIAVGRGVSEQLRSLGVRPVVVGEALSTSQIPSFRHADAAGLFWCGTLARWKGLEFLLDAYNLAKRTREMPRLDVCVAPWPEGYLDAGRVPMHLPEGVHIHECSTDLDLIRSRALVYVHTALSEEPFGRSVLEAAHAGLCPIVPEHSTVDGLIVHGESGMVFEGENVAALAGAMIQAVSSPRWTRHVGEVASLRARTIDPHKTFAPVFQCLRDAARGASRASVAFVPQQTGVTSC